MLTLIQKMLTRVSSLSLDTIYSVLPMNPWYAGNARVSTVLRHHWDRVNQDKKHCNTADQPMGGLNQHTWTHQVDIEV